MRALLGVRKQTPNQVVLTECGMIELKELVRKCQQRFINSKLVDPEEPLSKIYRLCQQNNTNAFRCLQRAKEFVFDAEARRKQAMNSSEKTRTVTYRNINPQFSVHGMYKSTDRYYPDYRRVEVTRFRVGSHRLKVETGRWSRTPRELRVCSCGTGDAVQDEGHVVFDCDYTEDLRLKYGVVAEMSLVEVLRIIRILTTSCMKS